MKVYKGYSISYEIEPPLHYIIRSPLGKRIMACRKETDAMLMIDTEIRLETNSGQL